MSRPWLNLPLLAAATLLALAGCGSDDGGTAVPEASATVGAAGGTVQGPDGVQLVVPAGALAADTTIRIARTAAGAPALPEDLRPDVTVYEVTPHELQFAVPAQLRLPLGADPTADTTVIAASRGGEWSTVTARYDGRVAVIDRTSLSWFNVSNWGSGAACAIPVGSTDPYPCVATIMVPGTTVASPSGAISPDGNTVTGAATLTVPVTFYTRRDCANGQLVVKRSAWGPGRPTSAAQTVYDQPLPLSPYSTNQASGSANVPVPVSAADNGFIGLQFSFSCTRAYRSQRATAGGFLSLTVAVPVQAAPPTITEAPADVGVPAGAIATFTVRATAPQGLSVVWQRSDDAGATWVDVGAGTPTTDGSTYSLTASANDQGARFRARVCNGSGATQTCIDSPAAALSITPVIVPTAPTITQQPTNQAWVSSGSIVFTAAASGTPTPTLGWAVDGTALGTSGRYTQAACAFDHVTAGGTLTLTNVSAACIGATFVARASNASGSAQSNGAMLVSAPVATLLAGVPGNPGSTDSPNARFFEPNYFAFKSAEGVLIIGEAGNSNLRVVTLAGEVSTLAGGTMAGFADGTGRDALFNIPGGVVIDSAGHAIVADFDNSVLRRVTPAGVVTTIAGAPGQPGSADGTGSAARFRNPNGLAIDENDNVYVADFGNSTIRRVTPAGVVTTIAGAAGQTGTADGPGAAARFDAPAGLARDGAGNLYVADQFNHTMRRIDVNAVVTTLAGGARQEGHVDAAGAAARFSYPAWVATTTDGTVFVVSAAGDTVRRIDRNGNVTTVVGVSGQNSALRVGVDPRLRSARGLWVSPDGRWLLLMADQAVLRIDLP